MQNARKAKKTSDLRKQSFDYEQIAMSYHESSHAIVAISNFMHVFNVSIMTPKNSTGYTDYYTFDVNSIEDIELHKVLLLFELQTLYAGLCGEKIYYKDICGSDAFPMHLRIGSSDDTREAAKLIRKHSLAKSGKLTYILKKQMQKDVDLFLTTHWDAVKKLSHNLYKKHRLSFDEIKYILTRKTNENDFWKEKFKKIAFFHKENRATPEQDVKDIILENNIFTI